VKRIADGKEGEPMADEMRQGGLTAWVIVLLLLLPPLLYTLSIGPAVRIIDETGRGEETAKILYAPVIWMHKKTPLKRSIEWYVGWWEKKR
jgi:hypothetical protein